VPGVRCGTRAPVGWVVVGVKLLFDENLSVRLVGRFSNVYPGSQHVGLVGLQGKTDREIWDFAAAQGYAVVSKDNDFRQLSFLYGSPPKIVWLSVGNAGTDAIAGLLERSSSRIEQFADSPEDSLLVLTLVAETG
jgi:predicted nuclease of predicted toxin-antitoxin system